MKREIKFRIWNKVDKVMLLPESQCDLILSLGGYLYSRFDKEWETMDNYVVMQYIGLEDKNGSNIYDGDIIEIRHPYKDRMFSGVVSWEGYMWSCKEFYFTHFDVPSEIFSEGTEYIEIIGNIYENTELIKTFNETL